jgi:hypothetical protein
MISARQVRVAHRRISTLYNLAVLALPLCRRHTQHTETSLLLLFFTRFYKPWFTNANRLPSSHLQLHCIIKTLQCQAFGACDVRLAFSTCCVILSHTQPNRISRL